MSEEIRTTDNTKGRWLVAGNLTVRPRHFPHPSRDAKDDESLSLGPFQSAIVDPAYLDSPSFTRHVRTGENADDPEAYLEVYWSDEPPSSEFDLNNVVEELVNKEVPRSMALNVYYICAQDPIPQQYADFLTLEPSADSVRQFGATSITSQWDLLRNHLPWLREVRELESRWRKRDAVLGLIDLRIDQLEEMRRTGGL